VGEAGGAGLPVIKALPHDALADLGGLRAGWPAGGGSPAPLAYLLIDTRVKPAVSGDGQASRTAGGGVFGGSGKVFDWTLLERHPLPLPYFLAGGLGPHNLA